MNFPPAPFIVGVARSGTTLLRLMLDAHPALAIPGETHFLATLIDRKPQSKEEFLAIVTGSETWENMALDRDALSTSLDRLERFSVPDATRALYRLYASRFGKSRWGDKTGRYLKRMTALSKFLPEAHFVHIIRDGRDTALSLKGLWFGPGNDAADLAKFWAERITRARKQAAQLPHYLEIRYEALVEEPERVLRQVCDFIALPFDPAMLTYHHAAEARLAEYKRPFGFSDDVPTDLATFTAIYARAATPPDTARIGRWRSEMPREEQRQFEAVAGPMLRELGYETAF
jgi:hypothetical protein